MKIEDGTADEGKWQTECNGGGSPRRLSSLKSRHSGTKVGSSG